MKGSVYIFVLILALVGVALGAYAYFAPETGVEGTGGALLALVGALAVSLGALLAIQTRGGWLVSLNFLIGLASLLTVIAAWFLMQYPFAAAMALSFVGLLIELLRPAHKAA